MKVKQFLILITLTLCFVQSIASKGDAVVDLYKFYKENPELRNPPPMVKIGSIGTFWKDLGNCFIHPGSSSFLRFWGDIWMFYLIPFSAGFLRVEAHKQYLNDQTTYDNAEITENTIYTESFRMVKTKFYQVLGKN